MTKINSKNDNFSTSNDLNEENNKKDFKKRKPNSVNQFRKEILKMNYNDCLEKLDNILSNLQNDSIQIDELQKYYMQGHILLERCQFLLDKVEQEVIEMDEELFKDSKST